MNSVASVENLTRGIPRPWRQILLATPFALAHLAVLGVLWTGARPIDVLVCLALYVIRMFGVTAGYHRYFSHRSFKTSRVAQFVLAVIATSSAQKGVLWWAAHHRVHHKKSDTVEDVHSPRQRGFVYSHVGWLFDGTEKTDERMIRDLSRYPELVFLNNHWWMPPVALAVVVWLTLGWSGLFVGFFLSTVFVWHATFTINSLSHVLGVQAYETGDDSRNNWFFALVTLGEGWHNNHHYYQSSARQGFRWWQLDITYLILRALAAVGVVWDVREPPKAIVDRGRRWSDSPRAIVPLETIVPVPSLEHLVPILPAVATVTAVPAVALLGATGLPAALPVVDLE